MSTGYELIKSTFEKKNVLVTGHTGFKGPWLSLYLRELGAHVVGYALEPPTQPNMFEALRLDEEVDSIIGDIRDAEKLKKVFREYQPQFVFHMAAQPLVRDSYMLPKYTYEVNVLGTVNTLEAVRNTDSVRVVLNITTDKCYENREWVWGYRENDPLGGYDPYSSSKASAELVTAAYRSSYFNPPDYDKHKVSLSSVRAGNMIGGGDWAKDRLVPDCVRALTKNEDIPIRNPLAIRPWQHVLEPLGGYLLLAAKMSHNGRGYAQAWNFGPHDEDAIPVKEMVQRIIRYWGHGSWKDISRGTPDALHEAKYLKLDCSKARHLLGWQPVLRVDQAVKLAVLWYKEFYDRSTGLKEYTKAQIQEFSQGSKQDHD